MDAPKSFRDASYDALDADTTAQLGLPAGLLPAIRTHGERSNADQVSEDGARTVYQIIPATRVAAVKKWGVDPYLSPENASLVAGYLLKDSLDRNKGDVAEAVQEYHGGTNREQWGPRTKAYAQRVAAGMQPAKESAMGADFAKWMAANPAAPAAADPAAATSVQGGPPAAKPLDQGFAAWMNQQRTGPDAIPVEPGANTTPTAVKDPTLGEQIVGAGEAGLNAITGLTGGAAGMVGGAIGGLAGAVASGKFGTQEGAQGIEDAAAQGADAITYSPRTPAGQSQAQALGGALQQTIPLMPLAGEMGMAGRAVKTATPVVADAARAAAGATVDAAGKLKKSAIAMTSKATQTLMGHGEASNDGGMVGVGAAETNDALQRRVTASELPVPMDLTEGQATRNQQQLQFEGETAKGELGQPLRENGAKQNAQLAQNFEALIDSTGAEAPNAIETGRAVVDNGLIPVAAKYKNKYRVLYQQADKAGEMEQPVNMQPLADYLNANRSGRSSAPILQTIADELKVQGIGDGALADGSVTAGDASLKVAEAIRKAVNKFAKDTDPNDLRVGSEIKTVIDGITEGAGGDIYKAARAARQRYSQLFENNKVVADLLNSRRGTADRKVALEDVFNKTVLNGSREDLSMLRRTLQVAGDEAGAQAWRELQGATLRHLLDKSTENVATDIHGNAIFSAAKLNAAVRALDANGRLEFVLGKRRAQAVRDVNEIAKAVLTFPPGTLNTSNSAAVFLAALAEAGATGGLTGLPVPVLSTLRMATKYMKDRAVRQRVQAALGRGKAPGPTRPVPPAPPPRSAGSPAGRTVH